MDGKGIFNLLSILDNLAFFKSLSCLCGLQDASNLCFQFIVIIIVLVLVSVSVSGFVFLFVLSLSVTMAMVLSATLSCLVLFRHCLPNTNDFLKHLGATLIETIGWGTGNDSENHAQEEKIRHKTRQDKTRQDNTTQGNTRQGNTGQDTYKTRQGKTR